MKWISVKDRLLEIGSYLVAFLIEILGKEKEPFEENREKQMEFDL